MRRTHEYRSRVTWQGSTGAGYDDYSRAHRAEVPPAQAPLSLSADPAFRGDPALANPEQLLLAAASSCQLLSFLALAARSHVDVVAYEDEATAVMPEDSDPVRITQIVLRPRITVAGGTDRARVLRLVGRAHDTCFVANSLRVTMRIEPTIELR